MNRSERRHPDDMVDWPEEYLPHESVSTRPIHRQTPIGGVMGCRYVKAIVWQP